MLAYIQWPSIFSQFVFKTFQINSWYFSAAVFILVGCHFTYSTIKSGKAVKGYSACHAALCDSYLSLILHLGHKVTALSCLALQWLYIVKTFIKKTLSFTFSSRINHVYSALMASLNILGDRAGETKSPQCSDFH